MTPAASLNVDRVTGNPWMRINVLPAEWVLDRPGLHVVDGVRWRCLTNTTAFFTEFNPFHRTLELNALQLSGRRPLRDLPMSGAHYRSIDHHPS